MRLHLVAVVLIFWSGSLAWAGFRDDVAVWQAEIEAMRSAHQASRGREGARADLNAAFDAGGVGWARRYLESWSDWAWLDWRGTLRIFDSAQDRMEAWREAVESGQAEAAQVAPMLARGMDRLRLLNARMPVWFEDDLANWAEQGRWLDRANEVGCCGRLWQLYQDRADAAFANSISPDYALIGRIEVFPAVPESGGVPALPRPDLSGLERRLADAIAAGDRGAIRSLIRDGEALLWLAEDPALRELAQVLRLLRERLEYRDAPIAPLLDEAEKLPEGPLRDALLRQAEDALMDRAGHMAQMLADPGVEPARRESAATWLLDNARRLAQLSDDARGRFGRASGAARLFSGLSAASRALEAAGGGDVSARELSEIIDGLGRSFPAVAAPVAPFSGPMGAVAAEIDMIREGFELASRALDGVGAAIAGDPGGLERARDAARSLEALLSPERFIRNMSSGLVEGVVRNVPFARAVYDWFGN